MDVGSGSRASQLIRGVGPTSGDWRMAPCLAGGSRWLLDVQQYSLCCSRAQVQSRPRAYQCLGTFKRVSRCHINRG